MLVSAPDSVAAALGGALDGLSTRLRVTADNVANSDTPGFTAATVDFESSLRSVLADGDVSAGDVTAVEGRSANPAGTNGNNVDLATETMTAMQSTFQYQLLSRAVGDRFGLITNAIGGR